MRLGVNEDARLNSTARDPCLCSRLSGALLAKLKAMEGNCLTVVALRWLTTDGREPIKRHLPQSLPRFHIALTLIRNAAKEGAFQSLQDPSGTSASGQSLGFSQRLIFGAKRS